MSYWLCLKPYTAGATFHVKVLFFVWLKLDPCCILYSSLTFYQSTWYVPYWQNMLMKSECSLVYIVNFFLNLTFESCNVLNTREQLLENQGFNIWFFFQTHAPLLSYLWDFISSVHKCALFQDYSFLIPVSNLVSFKAKWC